jgi:hypothetical protein
MDSYIRSMGWQRGTYQTAIGIRVDEADRMNAKRVAQRLWYPLVDWGVRKQDVRAWWRAQPFDLDLQEHEGNCTWCWKKSLRKHLTLIRDRPEVFDFPRRMERLYPDAGAGKGGRRFFRGKLTVDDLFERAKQPFRPFVEDTQLALYWDEELDVGSGCGESCEIGADEVEEEEEAVTP